MLVGPVKGFGRMYKDSLGSLGVLGWMDGWMGVFVLGRNTGKKDSLQWSENIRMFVYGRHKQLPKAYFDSNGINTKELKWRWF